ncbi:MAG: LacI family DNA-binding transcriptional regulator [Anaerolineales bacterium]|nr:LacI family DNA-binding transcriptional regulator [Anaerolineales bacterium]
MSKAAKVTIQDIAHKAQVSQSTVSRVLSGNAPVAATKRTAVLAAIDELNYRPNIFAQSLASGQSLTIGVLTQNFGNPFYDGILVGILQTLEPTPYSPIFGDGRWQLAVEKRALRTLIDRQVDGLIVVGGLSPQEEILAYSRDVPLIVAAREIPDLADQCLFIDNKKAAYDATCYLIDMGHRHIAHVTAPMYYHGPINDIFQRYQGYIQALTEAGIEPDPQLVVEGDLSRQSGLMALQNLVASKRPFTAIFAANDQMAIGIRLGLYRRGLRVPEDVSLVGFDDEPTTAYLTPPLTTVRQPAIELGQTAAQAILDLINANQQPCDPFDTELIIRESVARRR